jgi:hypothetical protein
MKHGSNMMYFFGAVFREIWLKHNLFLGAGFCKVWLKHNLFLVKYGSNMFFFLLGLLFIFGAVFHELWINHDLFLGLCIYFWGCVACEIWFKNDLLLGLCSINADFPNVVYYKCLKISGYNHF